MLRLGNWRCLEREVGKKRLFLLVPSQRWEMVNRHVEGGIMVPKDVHVLILRVCEPENVLPDIQKGLCRCE